MTTEYKLIKQKIKDCIDTVGLTRVERTMIRLYTAGLITNSELSRLDCMLVDKAIDLEGE